MKLFLTMTLLFILALNSFALKPKIGDSAIYSSTYTEGSTSVSRAWQKTILDLNMENQWLLTAKVRWESNSPYGYNLEEWVSFGALFYIENTEEFCMRMQDFSKDAQLELISVTAGTFESCKVTGRDGGQTWYSKEVPFGVLKRVSKFNDGAISEDILTNYKVSQ